MKLTLLSTVYVLTTDLWNTNQLYMLHQLPFNHCPDGELLHMRHPLMANAFNSDSIHTKRDYFKREKKRNLRNSHSSIPLAVLHSEMRVEKRHLFLNVGFVTHTVPKAEEKMSCHPQI